MTTAITVRPIQESDYASWLPLWDAYNAFYGKVGATALAPAITQTTWQRFFDPAEPVFSLVASIDGKIVGITHYLYHRSTSRLALVTYLQDLFTEPTVRGRGVGRALINAVYAQAKAANQTRVYWQTHETNATGRMLYEKVAKNAGFLVYGNDF